MKIAPRYGASTLPAVLLLSAILPATAAFAARKSKPAPAAAPPQAPILLRVDMTDAPRHLIHAHENIPVAAGPLVLEYPEWIPGNHRPTGPIDNVAGLFIKANGQPLPWRRDEVDMYGVHVDVPQGVTTLDVDFDYLVTPGGTGASENYSTSKNLAVLEWNSVVMYPAGIPVRNIPITPSITLPAGWGFGTALAPAGQDIKTSNGSTHPAGGDSPQTASFATVGVNMLVDSPLIAGRYFKEIPLAPGVTPKHYLDLAADAQEDLDLKPATLTAINNLVHQAGTVYASRHYYTYHFLLSLSDEIRGEGLEHHQSSDNGIEEHGFSDPQLAMLNADLLSHEYTHSWNGKYRRPAGLATPDYKTPMRGDLLWVYEGMTQYWGGVLAARSGLWTPQQYRDALAFTAANMDNRPGRTWRNVEDTAIAASILRGGSPWWSSWRLSQDYYPEGDLIWLDADTTIRQLTHGQKSLNDFVAIFLGLNGNTGPITVPYTLDDIVIALNKVVPYDWRGFLTSRVESHEAHAPLNGIEHGGYKLVYTDQPSDFEKAAYGHRGGVDCLASLGMRIGKNGAIADVLMNSLAYKAGLGPGVKIVAVNNLAYTDDRMKQALRAAKTSQDPIQLIITNTDEFQVVHLDYHGGERYPHLERDSTQPDLLDDIIKPLN
ncbi:MAG: M61 family metallopeptidase [Acidobacteria bacterium]|nr:M61 family metallopeptidase [Acidobacteriota bacterium]MBW4046229.1 M61 family metallopeptidase [Acidobacteriota bacterium]